MQSRKTKETEVDWTKLSDKDLIQQSEIYEELVDSQLDKKHKKILSTFLEIERELTLREEQPH